MRRCRPGIRRPEGSIFDLQTGLSFRWKREKARVLDSPLLNTPATSSPALRIAAAPTNQTALGKVQQRAALRASHPRLSWNGVENLDGALEQRKLLVRHLPAIDEFVLQVAEDVVDQRRRGPQLGM